MDGCICKHAWVPEKLVRTDVACLLASKLGESILVERGGIWLRTTRSHHRIRRVQKPLCPFLLYPFLLCIRKPCLYPFSANIFGAVTKKLVDAMHAVLERTISLCLTANRLT